MKASTVSCGARNLSPLIGHIREYRSNNSFVCIAILVLFEMQVICDEKIARLAFVNCFWTELPGFLELVKIT